MNTEKITGRIQGNEKGYAFLIPDDTTKSDYFIPKEDLSGALHNDTVIALATDGVGERTTARVLKILSRGNDKLVGVYYSCKKGGKVCADERKFSTEIFIPSGKGVRAKSGDKVIVKIISYPKRGMVEGIITQVLGRQFEKKAELKALMFNYKLSEKFPKSVLDEVQGLPDEPSEKDFEGRRDLRAQFIFTIDGEDAKDFDDAVSIDFDGEFYVLGVHIADVSHYCTEDSQTDKQALIRGTSVYFPESVIPMLPEKLSNGLCSLKPNCDRLALSTIMKIDKKGNVVNRELFTSVIKSKARTTYNQIEKIILSKEQTLKNLSKIKDEDTKTLCEKVFLMDELCDILSNKRREKGSIDLDVKESKITCLNGVVDVLPSERLKSQKIIEEFMVLTNVVVAEYLFYMDMPCIYRVHGKPQEDRLENFYNFLNTLGIPARRSRDKENVYPKDFQIILDKVSGSTVFPIVNRIMLRTMQKAKYSPENIGHFGLGETHYCHFTSPIRRYPDLVVHRILKQVLNTTSGVGEKYSEDIYSWSTISSEKERNAQDAERAVDDYYKMLYMSDRIGEEYDGVISGVTAFGVFVELANGVEGLVKLENIRGKKFNFDPNKYSLSSGYKNYKLGQQVRVFVAGVNTQTRKAEFIFVE